MKLSSYYLDQYNTKISTVLVHFSTGMVVWYTKISSEGQLMESANFLANSGYLWMQSRFLRPWAKHQNSASNVWFASLSPSRSILFCSVPIPVLSLINEVSHQPYLYITSSSFGSESCWGWLGTPTRLLLPAARQTGSAWSSSCPPALHSSRSFLTSAWTKSASRSGLLWFISYVAITLNWAISFFHD